MKDIPQRGGNDVQRAENLSATENRNKRSGKHHQEWMMGQGTERL